MSVFMMGVYDEDTNTFRTVCRVANGHDDATLQRLQTELKMIKIQKVYISETKTNRKGSRESAGLVEDRQDFSS